MTVARIWASGAGPIRLPPYQSSPSPRSPRRQESGETSSPQKLSPEDIEHTNQSPQKRRARALPPLLQELQRQQDPVAAANRLRINPPFEASPPPAWHSDRIWRQRQGTTPRCNGDSWARYASTRILKPESKSGVLEGRETLEPLERPVQTHDHAVRLRLAQNRPDSPRSPRQSRAFGLSYAEIRASSPLPEKALVHPALRIAMC